MPWWSNIMQSVWPEESKQVKVQRLIERGSEDEAEAYFHKYPHLPKLEVRNPNIYTDEQWINPLHLAVRWRRLDMIRLLVKMGISLGQLTSQRRSCLHLAAMDPDYPDEILNYLLEKGAPMNLDRKQNVPMHYAAEVGNVGFTRLLFSRGYEDRTPNADGLTPYQVAEKRDRFFVIQAMEENTQRRRSFHRSDSGCIVTVPSDANIRHSMMGIPENSAVQGYQPTVYNRRWRSMPQDVGTVGMQAGFESTV